jgi:DNA polymerase-3 subunit epsilon
MSRTPQTGNEQQSIGIRHRAIHEMPFAVFDFETTGMLPDYDRVVEVSVVRYEPGTSTPRLVLDTLIHPQQPVSATEIHGITSRMVKGAPTFKDVWPAIQEAMSGCVIAAYNASFDMRFLGAEISRLGLEAKMPYVCLMNMRSLIGRERCKLSEACREAGVRIEHAHRAAGDAMASAKLLPGYFKSMGHCNIVTFDDLCGAGKHVYMKSFVHSPLPRRTGSSCNLCPRESV